MSINQDTELVVVGFTGELKMLALQARSLAKYAEGAFTRIHYVVNDRDIRAFQRFFEDKIKPELGNLVSAVVVTPGDVVAGQKLKRTDWRSQQSLKLLAARLVEAPQFLILDSKNHFIRPVSNSTFVTDDGRMKTHRYGFNEKFRPKFENACRYFGTPLPDEEFLALPTATPFMMSTQQARDLVSDVEARQQTSFHSFFCGNKDYTEFYFYLAYLLSKAGLLEKLYQSRSRPQVTLFRSVTENEKLLDDLLPVLDREDVYCFGVHRALAERYNPRVSAVVSQTWLRFGLVKDGQEAAYFLTPDVAKPKRWYWPF